MSQKNKSTNFSNIREKDFDVNVNIGRQNDKFNGSIRIGPSDGNGPTFEVERKPNGETVVKGGYKKTI
jgi:hypothetical protein